MLAIKATAPGLFTTSLVVGDGIVSASVTASVTVYDIRSCPDAGVFKGDGSVGTNDAVVDNGDAYVSTFDAAPATIDGSTYATSSVKFKTVSAGWTHACGVKTDGTIACWGDNSAGKATPPTGAFVSVSAGGLYTCGLKTDGTIA